MRVVISQTARGNMRAIRDYYAETSPAYADRVIERLYRRFQQLQKHPDSGAVSEHYSRPQIREIIESGYRILYRITPDGIEILAIRHGARDLPHN